MNISECKGYELLEKKDLSDIKSKGYILRHKKTGARINLISNDDDNKVFYVGFRTPSKDSTGVAHIVEHTVLCGSRRFPAKDPFVELVKGSLNTFLNAITYPDKTIYPIASCNEADFQNLMHVYLDAVFYPNIYKKKEIFQQEGWHYEIMDANDPITLNGVVYNEMKGAFSSPEGVLDRQILNTLYPDTSYRHESGGDPEDIPNLTYEEFLDFHGKYYHPANSYIYLYGNMDMAEKLEWLDHEYLNKFEKIEIDSRIKVQEPFPKPAEKKTFYSIASGEQLKDNTYLSCSFSVDTVLDEKFYLAFDIIEYALLGAPGAPLKKALLDAKIGKDIMSSYDNGTYQPIFSIVAKNSNPEKKEEFLEIIKRVLREQVEKGLNKKSLLAGLNSFEFKFREADFGNYPKGLLYGIQCLDSWLYDDEKPYTHLNALKVIDFLKKQLETDYFEKLIEKYLLNNEHAAIVIVEPQHGLNAKIEKQLEEKLTNFKKSLSPDEIEQLITETKLLKEYQEQPSTKEELEAIPMLSRGDLKREAEPLSNEERVTAEIPLLYHDVKSNGIAYMSLLFDSSSIAVEDISYLGILKAVLGFVDTEHFEYSELASEINLNTGGISSQIGIYSHAKYDSYLTKFEVRAKSLYEKIPKTMELIEEIISKSRFSDTGRLYEIVAQLKSRLQMNLSSSGHTISAVRAMSYFSETSKYTDMTSGIAFYRLIDRIEQNFEQEKDTLVKKLESLVQQILRPENLMVSIGAEQEGLSLFEEVLPRLKKALWNTESKVQREALTCTKENEGFMDASKVQYVSRAGNFKKAGFSYTGTLKILKTILSYEYLWQNIRVKGGAYGCMTGFSRKGDSYFASYRDPNLEKTNQIYEGTTAYIRNFTIDERDMTKYIIGTFSDMDAPMTPYTRAGRSLNAYLTGVTFFDLQKERDEVLDADQESIRTLADLVEAILQENAMCVIGNEEKLKEHSEMFEHLENLL